MSTQENQYFSPPTYFDVLFDWSPDLARFEREVDEAAASGAGDSLTLAEMECSLDLIEAEIVAMRGRAALDDGAKRSMAKLVGGRDRLARLIDRLRPLVPEY
jgi:hypothetical protein